MAGTWRLFEHGSSVRIVPENPTSADDLRTIITGGGNVTFRWEKNGLPVAGEEGPSLSRKFFVRGDTVAVRSTINGAARTALVVIGNSPPRVESVVFSPPYICRGTDITAKPAAFDVDGDEIRFSYRWRINGREVSDNSETLRGDRFKAGDKVGLTVVPTDGRDEGKPYITQQVTIPDGLPVFVSTPPPDFRGHTYVYSARAVDPDGGALKYSLVAAPPGMTINESTGEVLWPVTEKGALTQVVEVEAVTATGLRARQKFTINATVP
ncbi:hypothetical protein GPICK_05510 [Geobacter pickeringii]|uniref:Uncharacterized protein n=2 Tax=Geobacter pickeringii TaxID=345632 RepID=A0A0B5B8M7_9BACT|nr:hypothetical protein GPICK_05510 [Geobacter pickeringii]